MANTPTFTMRLKPELRDALRRIAERDKRTLANAAELAIERFVESDKRARKAK